MITWKINQLHSYPTYQGADNVVFNVNWRCTKSYEDQSVWIEENTKIDIKVSEGFTSYDDLTENQILNWVWAIVGKNLIEREVENRMEALINPDIVCNPLPWNKVAPTTYPDSQPESNPQPEVQSDTVIP